MPSTVITTTKAMINAVGKSGGCCISGVEVGSGEGVGVGDVVGSGDNVAVTLDMSKRAAENNSDKIKVSISTVLLISPLSFAILSFIFASWCWLFYFSRSAFGTYAHAGSDSNRSPV
jgi:hypothetical protein